MARRLTRTERKRLRHRERVKTDAQYREAKRASYQRVRKNNPSLAHYRVVKARARKAGLAFSLTPEWFAIRYSDGRCELTGIPFAAKVPGVTLSARYPSVDRCNSKRGYTEENSRMVLFALNASFGDWGEHEAAAIWHAYLARSWVRA